MSGVVILGTTAAQGLLAPAADVGRLGYGFMSHERAASIPGHNLNTNPWDSVGSSASVARDNCHGGWVGLGRPSVHKFSSDRQTERQTMAHVIIIGDPAEKMTLKLWPNFQRLRHVAH